MIWYLLLLPLVSSMMDRSLPPLDVAITESTQELWLNARLNHFDASNTDTFPMRFFYNSAYRYSPHAVIFLGGGWEATPEWVAGGFAAELAQGVSGGMFYVEHRYYGLSRPSDNTTTSDLCFLTVDQALGDVAQFIQYIKSDAFEGGHYKEGNVALVGCSYAGSMATWMKLAYPHLVTAAFSDSGPLVAQEDFSEYLNKVSEVLYSQGGSACVASVEESITALVALLETAAGPAAVSTMFNTCTSISATTPLDVATFFYFIQEQFSRLVQTNPADIPSACTVLTTSHNDPVQRLANWVTSQPWDETCLETRYTEVVAAHTNTSYDSPHAQSRLQSYQACIQFGWFQSTTGADHPFLSTVPLEYFHQRCKDFFGNQFEEQYLRAGIERTNLFFAGHSHLPDGTTSAVASLDPWGPLAAQHHTDLATIYAIEGGHCSAILPVASQENEDLRDIQISIMNDLGENLQGYPVYASSATNILPTLTVIIAMATLFI